MRLLEELSGGDVFNVDNIYFLLTTDFKTGKTNDFKRCVSLSDGSSRWIDSSTVVDNIPIFTMDHNSTIIPIKETKKTDELSS